MRTGTFKNKADKRSSQSFSVPLSCHRPLPLEMLVMVERLCQSLRGRDPGPRDLTRKEPGSLLIKAAVSASEVPEVFLSLATLPLNYARAGPGLAGIEVPLKT